MIPVIPRIVSTSPPWLVTIHNVSAGQSQTGALTIFPFQNILWIYISVIGIIISRSLYCLPRLNRKEQIGIKKTIEIRKDRLESERTYQTMTLEELKQRKRTMRYTNERIAELSGVPLGTVTKIFSGATQSPRYSTMQALESILCPAKAALDSPDCRYDGTRDCFRPPAGTALQEETAVYAVSSEERESRTYTVSDYYSFQDEIRRELIDGKFYIMEAPTVVHQTIIGELHLLFRECIRIHGKECRVLLSPLDVQLNADQYTMVQPDLILVCDRKKVLPRVCLGAPDLVVEVMSPSSRSRDSILKLNKYMRAGVREFWLVDPENRTVIVYLAGKKEDRQEDTFHLYTFEDHIPVGISGDECTIDFRIVSQAIRDLT